VSSGTPISTCERLIMSKNIVQAATKRLEQSSDIIPAAQITYDQRGYTKTVDDVTLTIIPEKIKSSAFKNGKGKYTFAYYFVNGVLVFGGSYSLAPDWFDVEGKDSPEEWKRKNLAELTRIQQYNKKRKAKPTLISDSANPIHL
jgi:hypothetical protein